MSHKGEKMTQDAQNLVWVDMEMTGLEPETDKVLEIAIIITDKEDRKSTRLNSSH